MAWYAAHAIMVVRFKEQPQERYPAWENVLLIEAETFDEALAKAKALAKLEEGDALGTFTWEGRPATRVYGGIRQVVAVSHAGAEERLSSGDEITYTEIEVADETSLNRLVSGRSVTVRYEDIHDEPDSVDEMIADARAASRDSSHGRGVLSPETVRRLVAAALAEDVGAGDITTAATVPATQRGRGCVVAREPLVVCGLPLARETFASLDPDARFEESVPEGGEAAAGATIAVVEGRAAALLTGERVALNFLQRLSGIATLARRAVEEVAGTGAVILDTRKTTPTLREIEKYAVRVGGARNHRSGLYDAVLVKDNHLAIAGGITEAVRRLRDAGRSPETIEVEVEDLAGVEEALRAGVGRLLLDNFTPEQVAAAVKVIAGRAKIEVSGGLKAGLLRDYAEAGAHELSIGGLTHSAPAVDIAFDMEIVP